MLYEVRILSCAPCLHGCEDEVEIMSIWMLRETMDAIDWSNFDYHDLFHTADEVMVCPHLAND